MTSHMNIVEKVIYYLKIN